MNSILKRKLTIPVQGEDKEFDGDFLTLQVLLVMYSKNKLTPVDFLSSPNLSSVDITDISNGKENRKSKRSCKIRRMIHSLCKGLRKVKQLFCCFSSPTVS